MPLAPVKERALRRDRPVLHVAGLGKGALHLGKRRRRSVDACLDGGDERFLPGQTLELPGAQRHQAAEQQRGGDEHRPGRPAADGFVCCHCGRSQRPSAALLAYWSVIRTPLMSRSGGRQSNSASGIQIRKCTQSGGL